MCSPRGRPEAVFGGSGLVSRHGSHLAVDLGSARSEVYVGVLRVSLPVSLAIYLFWSFLIIAVEKSSDYVQAAAVAVVAVLVLHCVVVLPERGRLRLMEQWAAGQEVDRATALEATYSLARRAVPRGLWATTVGFTLVSVVVGAIAGATGLRLVQYAILGAVSGTAVQLIGVHSFAEAVMRPVRVAIAGDAGIGDSLPRSRPTFAAWSKRGRARDRVRVRC